MTTEKLKIVHEDNLEEDVRLAMARAHPKEAAVEDLSRLTAEAVQANYASTAKAVTAMGEKIKTITKDLEAAMKGLDDTMKALTEFVARVEDSSHEIAAKIDYDNADAAEVRQWANDFQAKLK
jgi:septal ring factor EnvC (AmiA/AmiB activator)